MQLNDPDRRVTDVLRELMQPTPTGKLVPLTSIASIDFAGNIGTIMHIDSERVVTVKANVEGIPGPVARMAAEEELEKLELPPGYKTAFTGEFEFQKESEEFLSNAFGIALLLIFLVLVTQDSPGKQRRDIGVDTTHCVLREHAPATVRWQINPLGTQARSGVCFCRTPSPAACESRAFIRRFHTPLAS